MRIVNMNKVMTNTRTNAANCTVDTHKTLNWLKQSPLLRGIILVIFDPTEILEVESYRIVSRTV